MTMKRQTETWKKIKEYGGKYSVSNLGRIRNNSTNKELKTCINDYGYNVVQLCKQGQPQTHLVHRLVAKAFIPNNKELPQINHKDEVKTNNNVNNLEWCTAKYNKRYSSAKPIMGVKYDVIIALPSLTDCTRLGFKPSALSVAANNGGRAYGFTWTYINKETYNNLKKLMKQDTHIIAI